MFDDDFVWTVIENESLSVPRETDWALLSLFSLGDRAEGITLQGVQYPLTDGVLTPEFPLGVSNHIMEETAHISVRQGVLAVGWQLYSDIL